MVLFRWLYRAAGTTVLTAALLSGVGGCHRPSATAPAESRPEIVSVTVVQPTRQNLVRRIEQPGFTRPYEETAIYSRIEGKVQAWYVDRGARVKKNALLARLYVPEREQKVKAAEARVEQAEAEFTQAQEGVKAAAANVQTAGARVKEAEAGVRQVEAEYRRWQAEYARAKALMQKNVYDTQTRDEALHQLQATAANLERAKAAVTSMKAAERESIAKWNKAKADVDAAQARVQVAEADAREQAAWLDYANIRAPYAGVVTELNIKTGDFVQPASSGSTNATAKPLFVVDRMDIMRVTVQVPEYDAVLVKDGTPAVVRFQALKGREFPGKVTLSSWSLDPQARTLLVEIHLGNTPKDELRPGMYVNTTIEANLSNVLALPAEAVLVDGNQHYCFTVVDGKAVKLPVEVGVRTKRVVQVLRKQMKTTRPGEPGAWEEFTGAERVIVSNPGALLEGQAVAPQPKQKE